MKTAPKVRTVHSKPISNTSKLNNQATNKIGRTVGKKKVHTAGVRMAPPMPASGISMGNGMDGTGMC